ncbi:MAG: CCA tRNA nucleotidyltransferase [Mycobacterium leprae]
MSAAQRRAVAELLRVSPVAHDLARRVGAAGHEIALVGGSVRDALLGRLGVDLDFATSARPEQVRELVAGWADAIWETGIEFGTLGVAKARFRLEITTYRSESYRRDDRHPEVVYGNSLEGDLARRDFTVNAMAVLLPDHVFVDPYGGLRDLAARVLRSPGRSEDSFSDDPLRMLRAARFAAQLGFAVAPGVVAAMRAMSGRLDIVAAERVRDELAKLVCGEHPRRGLTLLVDTGLADVVLPELPRLRLETDEHHRHKDVYEHSLTVLEQAIALEPPDTAPDLVLRLAALLHDIGKPKTRSFEPSGRVSFHHHEVVGAAMARARLSALRFPKPVVEDVTRLIELHLRFHGYGTGEWTDSAVRRYVRDAGPLLDRLHRLVRSDCTTRNRRKALALATAYDELERRIARLSAEEDLARLRPDLDGNEIMRILGVGPGPLVGEAYRFLLARRIERGPVEAAVAEAELRSWASGRGVPLPSQE